ncbi:metallophosphoesterase family protein [Roseivivax sediminis]|uniref:3',5'-cyclic AMP phosphodiesterase CpdA n=1 Tax=Roseivivax sediminis TaxID=936889 RepID=A0A1I1YT73_9RHOB|nr:metallophosphoesterase [Roseivivax sediminis]SFE21353.1 3',5'-cyclic AMP phosphodiesterase CpdA [Roseivivax sediminis]
MTARIAHLSDLHFGRDRPELAEPLAEAINAAGVELVVVSGDLTQRARHAQFRAARAFLDRLDAPILAVPGNHDTPLDNVAVRMVRPWARYRRHISRDLQPTHAGDGYVVCGLNSADPRALQRGRLRWSALAHAERCLSAPREGRGLGIVALHHPPEDAPGVTKRPMRGVSTGLRVLSARGADILLCGHLHVWRASPVQAAAGLLLVQAGTGLSTRVRGEPNDFNVLTLDPSAVTIERLGASDAGDRFETLSRSRFEKVSDRWQAAR